MTAVIFDLQQVLPLAEARLAESGIQDRVELVGGDFYIDPMPGECDLALLSAIIQQIRHGKKMDCIVTAKKKQDWELKKIIHFHICKTGSTFAKPVPRLQNRFHICETG